MPGKKKKRAENAASEDDNSSTSSMKQAKQNMKRNWREFHRQQRKLISLVSTGEITVENSADIIESVENLVDRMNEDTELLSDNSDQDEKDELWTEMEVIEKEAREAIRLAENAIKGKLSSASVNVSTSSEVSKTLPAEKAGKGHVDWAAYGVRNPQLPVFSGEDYEGWKVTFDAFVGDENIPDKFKMIQLKSSLSGDPLKLVSRYNPTAAGYTKARSELERKYGGVGRRIRRQLEEIRTMRPVRPGNCKDLDDLADRVQNLVTNLEECGCGGDLSEMSAYYILVKEKLPASYLKTYKRWQQDKGKTDSFVLFADWLADEAVCEREAQEMSSARQQQNEERKKPSAAPKKPEAGWTKRVFNTETQSEERREKCKYCNAEHSLENCPLFSQWTVSSRYHFCKINRICFRCLSGCHLGRNCRHFSGCAVNSCGGKHHTLLHADGQAGKGSNQEVTRSSSAPQESGPSAPKHVQSSATQRNSTQSFRTAKSPEEARSESDRVVFQTVPVKIISNGRSILANALLDPCSDASYLTEAAANELDLHGIDEDVGLETVNGSTQVTMKKTQVQLSSVDGNFKTDLNAFVIKNLSSTSTKIDWNHKKHQWNHLKSIPFPPVPKKCGIDMLIGLTGNTMSLFLPTETVTGSPGEPVAVKTPLGWTAFGPVTEGEVDLFKTLRTHALPRSNQEEIDAMREMTELELIGVRADKEKVLSYEDKAALKKVEASMKHDGERYEVCVPWRESQPNLCGNFGYALNRLKKTEQSIKKREDESLQQKYCDIFEDYVKKGYMLKIPAGHRDWTAAMSSGWFLPHFPVIREDRATTKIRLVFDAAAKYQGRSLNDELCSGPSICSDLIEILLGFRRHPIALTGDVEEMFLQVKLAADDRKYHRVLWRDGEAEKKPDIYEAQRWIFGNAAAPFAAQYVMKENAKKHAAEFPLAAEAVASSFYMDDALCSFRTEEEAKKTREQLTSSMKLAGMNIKKWRSNSVEVEESIPVTERAKESKQVIEDGSNRHTKTLGLLWNVREDTLGISTGSQAEMLSELRPTKRLCLKKMATVFDPLCLICPITINGKIIFQETWARGLDWDDALPTDMEAVWLKWIRDLRNVSLLTVPRCIHPFSGINAQRLHVFSDASEQAYAAVVYVVSEGEDGLASRLALARARVTPRSRKVTIPRLELMAALLGLRLVKKVSAEFDIPLAEVKFWSDSLNVLCWIKNDVKRFQPFVAHRISEIRDFSNPEQWMHIPGSQNPADIPSRGATLEDLKHSKLWWEGPPFLVGTQESWPKQRDLNEEACDSSEFRKEKVTTHSVRTKKMDSDFRLQPARYSKWRKLIRVTAWVMRFVKKLKQRRTGTTSENVNESSRSLLSEELSSAEMFWFRKAQEGFESEKCEAQGAEDDEERLKTVRMDKTIRRLSPILDDDGLIRVGGRLQRSGLTFEAKHPVLLPKNHDVTKLFVRHVHEEGGHEMGIEHTVCELRQRVWIISARNQVKKCIWSCPECIKRRKQPETQIMAPKPESQVKPTYCAFKKCAVDFAGPFHTRQGRGKSRQKRYLCLFLCQHTRAVHLEMAYGLDTDSFLRAFLRFIARRGLPSEIISDNGTNFIGAERELRQLIRDIKAEEVEDKTSHLGIKWQFIPPGAPHFNGGCEAMVKSAKRALYKTLQSADLNDEELQSAFCRVEATLNTRPITTVSSDPNDGPPLTPSSFLLGTMQTDLPAAEADQRDQLRKRWRRLQQLSSEFWHRWTKEYLPSLQTRQKWHKTSKNLREGDVVLITTPPASRGAWPLARVLTVSKGKDGCVRVVKVRTKEGVFTRPITKLVKLEVDGSDE